MRHIVQPFMFISLSLCSFQRFKGTEPIEEVTEQVKAVKIEEKPKEVKEVVDEVQLQDVDFLLCCYRWQVMFCFWLCTLTNFRCSCFSQGPPKYTKSVLKKGDKVNFPKKGETVSCWYTGSLEDGTVFDTNIPAGMTDLHLFIVRFYLSPMNNCILENAELVCYHLKPFTLSSSPNLVVTKCQ